MKRQLAVILYADAAGYSRLTGQDAEQTHRQLNTGLNLLTEKIADHGGNKVHEAGDAILAEFSSVTSAVETAVEFQVIMESTESELDKSEQIEFRIGINLGEVIHDRDDIYGDGVNIAARIQEVASPGGLCVSGAVLEQLADDASYKFDDLGFRDFKNIKRPIHVYRLKLSDMRDHYPIADIDSRIKGQPLFDDAIEDPIITKGQCACGSVKFEITQKPLGTGYCSCRICQRCTSAPVLAWVAFPVEAVKFTRDVPRYYRLSLIGEKGFCGKCGSQVVYRAVKPEPADFLVVPTATLEDPENYAPTWHTGIESQMPWLQIHDDLPRTRSEESPSFKKSWSSVGASDPNDWVALEYEQAKLLE
jgi:adenylate cyclase